MGNANRCGLALAALTLASGVTTACSTSSSEPPAIVASSSNTGSTARATTTSSNKGRPTTTVEPDATGATGATEPSRSTEPGGEPDPTDPDVSTRGAALPRACELITAQDAELAFGEPVQAGDQRADECWWSTANDLKTVNVIRRSDDVEAWRRGYQNDKWEPVDIGDEAYVGKVLDSISFRLGSTIYEVNVVYSTKGDPEQVVKDLTALVVSRL